MLLNSQIIIKSEKKMNQTEMIHFIFPSKVCSLAIIRWQQPEWIQEKMKAFSLFLTLPQWYWTNSSEDRKNKSPRGGAVVSCFQLGRQKLKRNFGADSRPAADATSIGCFLLPEDFFKKTSVASKGDRVCDLWNNFS